VAFQLPKESGAVLSIVVAIFDRAVLSDAAEPIPLEVFVKDFWDLQAITPGRTTLRVSA
jgi:hypothetical protein